MPQNDESQEWLRQAIQAVQTGRLSDARRLLAGLLRQDPENVSAWVWLGKAVDDPEKRRECFTRALHLDPANEEALRGLVAFQSGPSAETEDLQVEPPKQITAYPVPCRNCGAHQRYDISTRSLRCAHCGTTHPIPEPSRILTWRGLPPDMGTPEAQTEPMGRETLRCRSCGATTELSARTASLSCPYCGSPQVTVGRGMDYLIPPMALLPLAVDEAAAGRSLREWLGASLMRPSDLAGRAEIVDLHGAYLPFWAFKGLAEVSYRLQDASYESLPMIPTVQNQHVPVQDVLLPASYSIEEDILREIEPFDLDQAVPFRPEYLAGWPAEVYQVALADASIVARERMARESRNRAEAMAPVLMVDDMMDIVEVGGWGSARTQRQREVHYRPNFCTVHLDSCLHVMLPVWQGTYRYRGRTYPFAVNGQTGRAGGQAPRSTWMTLVAAAYAVVGLAIVIGLLIYFGPAIVGFVKGLGKPAQAAPPPTVDMRLVIVGLFVLLFLIGDLVAFWPRFREWFQGRK